MTPIQEYLCDKFGVNSSTSATILITLSVFFLGIIIQQTISTYSNYIQRKRIRRIFEIALNRFKEQVNVQSKAYRKVSETYRFDKESSFVFARATIFPSNSFENIGYQKIYDSYFSGVENIMKFNKGKKLKAFNKIWDSILSVDFWHNKSIKDIEFFNINFNAFNEKRNKAIENHRIYFESIITQVNGKEIPKALAVYIKGIDSIHVAWQNTPNRVRPDILHRRLIIPLRLLNRKNRSIEMAVKMNNNLLEATLEYQNQRNLLRNYQNQLLSYASSFRMYSKISEIGLKILKGRC